MLSVRQRLIQRSYKVAVIHVLYQQKFQGIGGTGTIVKMVKRPHTACCLLSSSYMTQCFSDGQHFHGHRFHVYKGNRTKVKAQTDSTPRLFQSPRAVSTKTYAHVAYGLVASAQLLNEEGRAKAIR